MILYQSVITNFSKTFLQIQSIFIVSNQKDHDLAKRSSLYLKVLAKLSPHKSYTRLHVSSGTLCDLFSFIPFIPTDCHQQTPLGCSKFAEPSYLFKQDVYIVASLEIMLQASWHIPEGN